MATVVLTGDEGIYSAAARAIAGFLTGKLPFAEMATEIVGNGWFTPGIPIFLTPVYLFDLDPHLSAVRLYFGLLILLLWIWAIIEVYRTFGERYVITVVVFPALDVTWRLFSITIWGDVASGLLLTIVFCRTWSLGCRTANGLPLSPRDVIWLQLIFVLAFYVRGNLIVVMLAVNVFLLALVLLSQPWRSWLRQAAVLAIGAGIFAAAISPWSILASRTLGGTVISTSTPVLAFGVTFGNGEFCLAVCPENSSIWYETVRFSRSYAAENGISELEAQRRMAAHALRDLTFETYIERVKANFANFLLMPSAFVEHRFLPSSTLMLDGAVVKTAGTIAAFWTGLLYFPALIGLALANFVIVRGSKAQIESLCIKMFTLCLFIQPFFHISHSRYWPVFGPLMALSVAFLVKTIVTPSTADGTRPLLVIQTLYVAVFGTAMMVVLLAS